MFNKTLFKIQQKITFAFLYFNHDLNLTQYSLNIQLTIKQSRF